MATDAPLPDLRALGSLFPEPVQIVVAAGSPIADIAGLNKAVFNNLKPGGLFYVEDHNAADGAGLEATSKFHRMDVAVAKSELTAAGFEVLLDDRDKKTSPGIKFADMELIGIPHRVVVSDRGIKAGQFEYRHRRATEAESLDRDALLARLGA